jgi:two-component system CheB/CheR fusion protein
VFASQGIELTLNLPTEPIFLKVDVGRLEQAMSNLLSNSLKFTDRGGNVHIALSSEAANDQVVISVSDTGIGIEPAVMRSIFNPLAHDSSLRNGSGLGLGLPLVKRLVELHDGHLIVNSDGPGKGAEFRILLPRAS